VYQEIFCYVPENTGKRLFAYTRFYIWYTGTKNAFEQAYSRPALQVVCTVRRTHKYTSTRMEKRILITGGAGFIASHVAIRLGKRFPNYKV